MNSLLHPAQQKLIDLLRDNQDEPLSIRELMQCIDAKSPSVVQHHLMQLERKGYLKRNPNNPRDYQILADRPDKQITYLNLYGMAQCGPNGGVLDGNPIDRIPISSRLLSFPSTQAFLVKARGTSMKPRINPGDLVIAKKIQDVENNQIAVCVNDGEVLIKKIQRIYKSATEITYNLISINPDQPAFPASKNFHIEGEVKGILKYTI
jgi:repressor LexA